MRYFYIADSDIDCSFEEGLCGYIQDTDDHFDWIIEQGSTPTIGTGPQYDHALSVSGMISLFYYIDG